MSYFAASGIVKWPIVDLLWTPVLLGDQASDGAFTQILWFLYCTVRLVTSFFTPVIVILPDSEREALLPCAWYVKDFDLPPTQIVTLLCLSL